MVQDWYLLVSAGAGRWSLVQVGDCGCVKVVAGAGLLAAGTEK